MDSKEMLLEFMGRFRLECHYRLDMVPGDIKDLPIFMYKAAQESAKESMIECFDLSEEDVQSIDNLMEFFIAKLQETDHYGDSDDIAVAEIKAGKFTN